jgi:RND family efflux transporter MFP subunit
MLRDRIPSVMKRRPIIVLALIAVVSLGAYYAWPGGDTNAATAAGGQQRGGGGFGPGGFGGGGGPRLPMTVEMGEVKRADMVASIQVVGNLIGLQTVEATPKTSGRLESVAVHLGDHVRRGQMIAKVEDREITEQVKQAQAAYDVSVATIRQRQADLTLAQTNLDRSRTLYERQLIPKQTLDDTDARYQSAAAQVELANAQSAQAKSRLEELTINLANTVIASPLTGVVAKRVLDPGAWVTPSSAFVSVVDISVVRLVASIVERDVRLVTAGLSADVEVDAYPGEKFAGTVAHVAPVLDPATRTAQIEVEIQNPDSRLKPGMYARVTFITQRHEGVLVVPLVALADLGGKRGVYVSSSGEQGNVAHFQEVEVGLMDQDLVEVTSGVSEGQAIVTTGAGALREGDIILLPGQSAGSGGASGAGGRSQGQGQSGGRRPGGQGAPPPGGGARPQG